MAITVAMRTQVSQLYVSLFGRAPDGEGLGFWVGALESGQTFAQVAQDMFNTDPARAYYPKFATNEEIIATFYKNVLGRTADAEGLAFWTKELDAAKTEGDVFAKLINNVVNYTGNDPAGLVSQALLKNKVEVAQYYGEQNGAAAGATSVLAGVTADPATVAAAKANAGNTAAVGQTFMLTVDAQLLTGTSGDDTFLAPHVTDNSNNLTSTMNYFDSTDGGAGYDTLIIEGEDDNEVTLLGTFANIEEVILKGKNDASEEINTSFVINASKLPGVEQIWLEDVYQNCNYDVEISELTNQTTVGMRGNTWLENGLDLNYKSTTTTSNIALDALSDHNDITLDGAALSTINLSGSVATSSAGLPDGSVHIDSVQMDSDPIKSVLKTINVQTNSAIAFDVSHITTLTKIDASASTGTVFAEIDLKDVSNTGTTVGVTYLGGSGNDNVTADLDHGATVDLDSKDVLKGGSGYDTLTLHLDPVDAYATRTVTEDTYSASKFVGDYYLKDAEYGLINKAEFEQINFAADDISDDQWFILDAAKLNAKNIGTAETSVVFNLENDDTVFFTGNEQTLDLLSVRDPISGKFAAGAGTVNLVAVAKSTTVDISKNLGLAGDFGAINQADGLFKALGGAGSDAATDDDFSDFAKLVLSGAGNVSMNNEEGYGVEIDASALKGSLTFTAAYDAVDKVTLGAGKDEITLVNDSDDDALSEFGTMDTITGFASGQDKLDVDGAGASYAAYTGELGLDFSQTASLALMNASDAGKDVASFVWNNNTYIVQDLVADNATEGIFDASTDLVVKLTGVVSLTATDFV